MNRVIVLAIAAVIISLLLGQVLKGGLGLLRIISIALVFFLLVVLSARPTDSPGLLPSLVKRIWSENSVQIAAEASGEVLTNEDPSAGIETSSVDSEGDRSLSPQSALPSNSISRSAEAAFSGSTTTASSNQIEASSPPSTLSTQSTTPSGSAPASSSSEVPPEAPRYTPPASASRPINALW